MSDCTYKIYRIINTVNQMDYIGCTNNVYARWMVHRSDARRYLHRPLYKAMNEYGLDKFFMEVIEVWPDLSTLFEREQYWIDRFGSAYPNGYNAATASRHSRDYQQSIKTLLEPGKE